MALPSHTWALFLKLITCGILKLSLCYVMGSRVVKQVLMMEDFIFIWGMLLLELEDQMR